MYYALCIDVHAYSSGYMKTSERMIKIIIFGAACLGKETV
jgi:hypothetical protein